jgi:hypothetical protein
MPAQGDYELLKRATQLSAEVQVLRQMLRVPLIVHVKIMSPRNADRVQYEESTT